VSARPILFSGPMVRAIIDGTKTQTRRIVKMCRQFKEYDATPDGAYDVLLATDRRSAAFLVAGDHGFTDWVDCPYGKPGDRLWVRETWAPSDSGTLYAADFTTADKSHICWKWRPSIFMRPAASRITLDVTDVRVERLQDISDDDARAEGVDDGPGRGACGYPGTGAARMALGYRGVYAELWDVINRKRAPWASNPWVWVVSFAPVGCARKEAP
jgi:hypothetical protein